MYAFNPPLNLSSVRHFHQAKNRTSSYTSNKISMHDRLQVPSSSSGLIPTTSSLGKSDGLSNPIGIIGGVSVFSTLIFLEKLVWWSSKHGKDCVPFILLSIDPHLSNEVHVHRRSAVIENLRRKREFLERSGVKCIVMPCHLSHSWYKEISQGCSLPFLHLGECVATELAFANLKPSETGSEIRIGLISTYDILQAGFYQEKLQKQGFEVLLPDRATMDNIILPAIAALSRKDIEGGQNLLRIAVSILLMRGASMIIIASDKLQGLLPADDPLYKKCINPKDALARRAISFSESVLK